MNPEARLFILYTTGKTNLFLIGKNVLMVMVPILIEKDVFEPSYNDIKFRMQNRNYLYTNLINFFFPLSMFIIVGFPGGSGVKNLPAMPEIWVRSLGGKDSLEEGMASHSSILAWRNPMDRGTWWAVVHRVTKSQTRLSN